MPIRGENIGTAYVRIVADGSGLDRSIRDSFHDQDDVIKGEGARHGDLYRDSFNEEFGKRIKLKEFNDSFRDALAKQDAVDKFLNSNVWKAQRARLIKQYGEAGALAGKNLSDSLAHGATFDQIRARLDNITAEVARATQQIQAEEARQHAEALAENKRFDQARLRQQLDMLGEAHRLNQQFDRLRLQEQRNTLAEAYQMNRAFDRQRQRDISEAYRFNKEFDRKALNDHRDMLAEAYQLNKIHNERNRRLLREGNDTDTSWLHRLNRDLDKVSDGMGRAFGKGSRNNFLNFFGSVIGNVTQALFLLPKLAESAVKVGANFATAFTGAGGGLAGLAAGFGTLIPLAASAAAGIAAFAIGLGILVTILGPVISLISLLLGALVALAGSIVFAAVGALAALAGAVVPLAIGIGGLVGGLATLDKKNKEIAASLKGLKDAAHDTFGAFNEGIDAPRFLDRVAESIRPLAPLMRAAGVGMSRFFDGIFAAVNSGPFHLFVNVFSRQLPDLLGSLGNIFGNTFEGLFGIFRALIPLTQEFLGWLEHITGAFASWANTRAGQQQIKSFLEDAAASAKSFGGFLLEATGFLGDLFDAGRSDGDRMFDSLTRGIREFRAFLTTKPFEVDKGAKVRDPFGEITKGIKPGRSPLEQWFKDARELAEKLGDAAVDAGKLMDTLDDPKARDNIKSIVGDLGKIIGLIGTLVTIGEGLTPWGILQNGIDLAHKLKTALDNLMPDHGFAIGLHINLPNVAGIVADLIGSFSGLGGRIAKAIGKVNVGGIIIGVGLALLSLLNPFVGAGAKILSRIGHPNVSDIIKGAATALADLLGTFVGATGKILSRIGKPNVANIIVGAAAALASLLNPFSGSGAKILAKIYPVNVAHIFTGIGDAISNLVGSFAGVGARILSAIGSIVIHPTIDLPSIPHINIPGPFGASGGLFNQATRITIGEAGPEALVPLNRPLSQVDPSVRWLSAIAQGLSPGDTHGANNLAGPGKIVNANIQVVTPTTDPAAVARETINALVGTGY